MTERKTACKASKSTHQIWVDDVIHTTLILLAQDEEKNIKTIVQRNLMNMFGCETLSDLLDQTNKKYGKESLEELKALAVERDPVRQKRQAKKRAA